MYKQKLSILINSDCDREKLYDEFETFLGNLCKTGQIQAGYETPYINNAKNEIITYQTSLEKTSLSDQYYDDYTKERLKNIEEWCNSKLIIETIGTSIPRTKDVCTCKKPTSYTLFTHAFNDTSPLDCGDCNKVIPIYRLQQLRYDDKMKIYKWEMNYKACDNLQLGCTVGEKWATKQMSDPKSQLSKEGLEICKIIKNATGQPTYYYLFNYRHIPHKKDKGRKCPSCNGEWLLKNQLHEFYDFKCDKCHLLSSFSSVA